MSPNATDARSIAWLVMWIWPSHLGLPLLLAVCILSPRITRNATFINMIVAEICAGVANSILLYTGHWRADGPEPPTGICLLQSSLLAGAGPMAAVASFGLVFQAFSSIRRALFHAKEARRQSIQTWLLVVAPFAVLLVFAIVTIVVGGQNTTYVSRDVYLPYCHYTGRTIVIVADVLTGIVLASTLFLEGWMIQMIFTHRHALRRGGVSNLFLTDTTLRIMAFTAAMSMALLLLLAGYEWPMSAIPDLVMCTMGTFLVLIFGTQMDILMALAGRPMDTARLSTQSTTKGSSAPLGMAESSTGSTFDSKASDSTVYSSASSVV